MEMIETKDQLKLLKRLLAHTNMPNGVDGCWISTYYLNKDGHARFKVNGKMYYTHRIAHQIVNGHVDPLTEEQPQVNHWCGVGSCWKPDHLYSGTQKENMRDAQLLKTMAKAVCGTLGGYTKHKRNKESPCKPCREASKAYHVVNNAKRNKKHG